MTRILAICSLLFLAAAANADDRNPHLGCWHVSANGDWWEDGNCPERPGDQGSLIYVDEGIDTVVSGVFYIDKGWGECMDADAPDIKFAKYSHRWQTTIDCRGKGDVTRDIHANNTSGFDCPIEPKYKFNRRPNGLWQLHIVCAAPSKTS